MMSDRTTFCCRISAGRVEQTPGEGGLIFPYWSFTKTVIAISTMMLAESGRLDLDAPVRLQPFTLRQLLSHTAGLPDYGTLKDYHVAVDADLEPWARDDLMRATMAQGLLFSPGDGWSYSNVGYLIVRDCVEEAAGMSLAAVVNTMIGARLELQSVELALTRQQFSRVHWDAAQRYHPGWVYHGCLIGSAADAAVLLDGLFSGQLLKAESLGHMLARRNLGGALDGRPWTECGYGLGLMSGRMGSAGRAIGHSGGGPFSVCAVYHFPDQPDPVTVACFAKDREVGQAEFAALRCGRPE